MARIKRDPKKVALAQAILEAYQPKSVEDMQDALKDVFGPMFEAMLKGEMNNHLGYDSNDKVLKKMIIAEMVMVRKHLKLLKVKSKLKFQEIEMVHLNLQLFLKDKKMYQLLKVRY